jgi:hypothetical protein
MALLILKVVAVLAVAVVFALSLAHALEYPGKMRLAKEPYLAVQTIYYPGFTIGGAAEPLAILLVLALLLLSPWEMTGSVLLIVALCGLIVVQGVFWAMTQPVNRVWVKSMSMGAAGKRFFRPDKADAVEPEWTGLRDRWERSHIIRCIAAGIALLALVVAIAR